jgi:hypothetical protein
MARVYLEMGDIDNAARLAKAAAPYLHAKLQAVAYRGQVEEIVVTYDPNWYSNNAHKMVNSGQEHTGGFRVEVAEEIVDVPQPALVP